jgi:hypothetical protein
MAGVSYFLSPKWDLSGGLSLMYGGGSASNVFAYSFDLGLTFKLEQKTP